MMAQITTSYTRPRVRSLEGDIPFRAAHHRAPEAITAARFTHWNSPAPSMWDGFGIPLAPATIASMR